MRLSHLIITLCVLSVKIIFPSEAISFIASMTSPILTLDKLLDLEENITVSKVRIYSKIANYK